MTGGSKTLVHVSGLEESVDTESKSHEHDEKTYDREGSHCSLVVCKY